MSKTRQARRAAKSSAHLVAEGPHAPAKTAEKGTEELARETAGSMYVEYVSILCLVCLGGSVAVVSLGAPMVHFYRVTQLVLGLPVP